jgi:glycosyltransferase involved in cell wall biosynthesis
MMRIFYDHQVTSLQDAGGVSRYHFELVRELSRRQDVTIEYLLGRNASILPFTDLASASVRIFSTPTRLQPGNVRYGWNALLTNLSAPLRGRFDIYHSTYQRWEPGVRCRALIATHHDSTPERFPQLFPDAAAIIERKRRLYERADAILCVSQASKADLVRFYSLDERKAAVVYHGFRPLHSPGADAGHWEGKPYILYVGSRTGYKNFNALLSAFAAEAIPKSMELVVVGGGPWQPAEIGALQALKLEGRVTLVPKATETELAAIYSNAALLVYPSLYEGFGFPPLEAMSVDCPVLVSRTSSLPEVCGDAAFYFDPTAPRDLVKRLAELVGDQPLRRSKLALGRAQVQRYTWNSAADATFEVYRRCLEGIPL